MNASTRLNGLSNMIRFLTGNFFVFDAFPGLTVQIVGNPGTEQRGGALDLRTKCNTIRNIYEEKKGEIEIIKLLWTVFSSNGNFFRRPYTSVHAKMSVIQFHLIPKDLSD